MKVIVFLDNATSYSKLALDNVQIMFHPPQPLDDGVIQNFKMVYRSYFINKFLTCVEIGCAL